jgi:RNA polymerase sigma factor (sigma-70 family)
MATESTRPLARQLLRVVLGSGDVADRDLLARFAASRDEEAFAELVRRHGPMVFGVCRRVTGHPHDAEDAFQAAFVVLARRAAQLSNPERLANWLYGVAYRTALEARTARRRVQEQPVSAAPEPAAPPEPDDTADLRKVIDEELAKLPDKYRTAVVLCDLEGLPRAAAAAQLKIPEGTLSSRLAYARKVLANRLTRRGVTASAATVATTLGSDATATVHRELVLLTARVAARATAGGAVPPGLVPPSVSNLADGVIRAMLVNRLRLMTGLLLTCGLIGLGAYGLAQVPRTSSANDPFQTTPVPQPPTNGSYVAGDPLSPDGQTKKALKVGAKGIEDDDVPYESFPAQAVVRIEEGELIVRQRVSVYEPVHRETGNISATSYERKSLVQVHRYDLADLAVFDMKGNRLAQKAWKEKFKVDVHVLFGVEGKLPNPRELELFKEDTLVVVLPMSFPVLTPPPVPSMPRPGSNAYPTQPPAVEPSPTPRPPSPAPSLGAPNRPDTPAPPAPPKTSIPPVDVPRTESPPEPTAPTTPTIPSPGMS